jgi:indole-3-glycerol phosphate synthase
MTRLGVAASLVGESLMREPDVEAGTSSLLAPTAPVVSQ